MRTFTQKTSILAIFLFFFASFCWAQTQTDAEKTTERQLAQDQKKEEKKTKPAKPAKVKSALELECDKYSDPHDKSACLLAQSKELADKSAKARMQAVSAEPDSMKEARKQIASSERKKAQAERDQIGAIQNAHISGCPVGSVWVAPGATELGWGFVHSRVIAVNRSPVPVDIRETEGRLGGQVVVKNLLPGCSLSLSQRIDYNGRNIVAYIATGSGPLGQGGTSVSQQVQIPYCSGSPCQSEYSVNWDIRLQQ